MQLQTIKTYIRNHKKTSYFILGLIICYSLYSLFHSHKMPPQDIKVVEIEKASLQNIQQTTQFIGTIKSEQATTLVTKSRGILDRFVNSGQHVKKGDLVAKIENKDIERNYKLSAEMEHIAKIQYDRFNQLFKKGIVAKNALEEKESTWIDFQKKLSEAKIALDDINIYAPFDGIVGIFKIREGSQVQEGDALVSFYDPTTTIVEFDVPIAIVKLVHDGSPVFIDNHQYALTYIQKMLDEETHMSPAYVSIQCKNCIIGSTIDVNLVTNEKHNVIVIPYEAVFLREGKTYVYIVKDNQAEQIPVELGIREKEAVEITSGLKKDDQVIIRGQARLYPSAPVKINQPDADKKS